MDLQVGACDYQARRGSLEVVWARVLCRVWAGLLCPSAAPRMGRGRPGGGWVRFQPGSGQAIGAWRGLRSGAGAVALLRVIGAPVPCVFLQKLQLLKKKAQQKAKEEGTKPDDVAPQPAAANGETKAAGESKV